MSRCRRKPGPDSPRALLDHTAAVTCLSWTNDGRLASGARDGKVRLHDRTGRLVHTWQRLGGAITQLAVHGDQVEFTFVQSGKDHTITQIK